jgi:hypothetical protein
LIYLPPSEDKLHIDIKNEQVHFILLSVCIIFAASKIGIKKREWLAFSLNILKDGLSEHFIILI